jgi:ribosomal protein S18 acetylase RimI-like enzyme
VFPEFRGQRVGSLLLGSLIARAESEGVRGLSLSVHEENPAKRLYARLGFEVVEQHGDTLTMLLELS